MISLGIFAKTFSRPTLEQALDAVVSHGINSVQFNFSSAGLPTLPPSLDAAFVNSVGEALRSRGLTVAAVSGTFNMIDPDEERRWENMRRFAVLAEACQNLGTSKISICTGTRDTEDMW